MVSDALELIREEEELVKMITPNEINTSNEDIEKPKEKKERTIVKTHTIEESPEIVKTLIEGFERMNLNLLEKIGNMNLKSELPKNYSSEFLDQIKKGECFHCKEKGHRKFECPKMNQREKKELGCIDVGKTENMFEIDSIFALEKRKRELKERSEILQKKEKVRKNMSEDSFKIDSKKEFQIPASRVRRKMDIKLAGSTDKYSIRSDLESLNPNINLAQLLNASPSIRKEFLDLFKKIESKEINSIAEDSFNVTNCKALIEIFDNHYVTVIDTGAACSIITMGLLEELGLESDSSQPQIIITADGTKHETMGKVSDVPVKIAGFVFPVDLLIMEKSANSLILGTDWLLKHKANIDLFKEELILPKEDLEVILSLSTKNPRKDRFEENELEYFGIAKEIQVVHQNYKEPNKDAIKLIDKYRDIFVEDLLQLKQTDITEHKIDTGNSNPVRDFGVPEQIISDRGSNFVGEITASLYENLRIKHTPTTAYRPQSNGKVERFHRTLKNILSKTCTNNQEDWDGYVWKVLLSIRTMKNSTTGLSPAELLYGVKLNTPATWMPGSTIEDVEEGLIERVRSIKIDLENLRKVAIDRSVKAKAQMKRNYDQSVVKYVFKMNDMVLRKIDTVQTKFQPLWEGPYKIIHVYQKGTYIIEDSTGKRDLVHGDRLKYYHESRRMVPEIVPAAIRSSLKRFK
ncbi:Gag-Pol polyprotein [Smittium culicis]|uniref:Gag-Pol polyprotein n=1 Tax=Smittium culicis TaxID=133412 RepID=A0A1R1XAY1_9FUNG|nr:Gag-Pol polyprotein [Smittium culicis]